MAEKKDWETAKTQFENMIVNAEMNLEFYKVNFELIKKKLAEFPEDKEEKEIKDAVEEVLK